MVKHIWKLLMTFTKSNVVVNVISSEAEHTPALNQKTWDSKKWMHSRAYRFLLILWKLINYAMTTVIEYSLQFLFLCIWKWNGIHFNSIDREGDFVIFSFLRRSFHLPEITYRERFRFIFAYLYFVVHLSWITERMASFNFYWNRISHLFAIRSINKPKNSCN